MPPEALYGTPGPDILQIGDGSDHDAIYGDEGNDTIYGLGGNDVLMGDGGNDRVWGGDGNDRVDGWDGNDRLWGGAGDDYFDAYWGDDTVYGGNGNDGISAGYGSDLMYGGNGNDSFSISALIDFGVDTAYGGADDDIATFSDLGGGHFDGGGGTDTVVLNWHQIGGDYYRRAEIDFSGPVPVLRSHSDWGEGVWEVTAENVEVLRVQTGYASDTVTGGDGDDWISVHLGSNVVDAGDGDDTVAYLTTSSNLLEGGEGFDTLIVGNASHLAIVFDGSGPTATDGLGSVLTGFERFEVYGGSFGDNVTLGGANDGFTGNFGNDTAFGGAGNDLLDGLRDDDELYGGDGVDRLNGGLHEDTLYGGAANDKLYGGHGADVLRGGDGRDNLFGAYGADLMYGDAGADTFRFMTPPEGATAEDRIGDFATGIDRLAFSQDILSGTPDIGRMTAADLSFGTVSGTVGQFLYVVAGNAGILYWDSDGTGAAAATTLVILMDAPTIVGTDIYIV